MSNDGRAALYSAIDNRLTHYDLDVERATLERKDTVEVPATVQYAWPHPTRRFLYVTTSNRGPGLKSDRNHTTAFRIDPASGALTPLGEPQSIPHRATHMCLDPAGKFALHAHNIPQPGITVRRIEGDGTIGAVVTQREALDYGIYPHQVRMTPSGKTMIVVDRGNSGKGDKAEDPGALRSFAFGDGLFSDPAVVNPNGGYGFGPRHVDFHPTQPWLYVSDEKRSQLYMFRMPDDRIEPQAAYTLDTLADRANVKPRQLAGTIHVHPNGRFVYVANRADYQVDHNGAPVFAGGENSIVVYAIDQQTGEPKLIQHADTHSYHVRTFAFDPSGRVMVAASIQPISVRAGNDVASVPAAMTVFRVGTDGKLEFVRKYDVDASGGRTQYWMGIVGLA